jgi:hypothetical protein
MARCTDIGPLIVHAGGMPHILLPLEIALSASKSYFGASTYVGKDNTGAASPVCTCALIVMNPNVNCGTPLNTPFGIVPGLNTHVADMSLADYLVGVVQGAFEVLLGYLLNKAMPGLTRNLFPQSVRTAIMARLASSPMASRILTQLIGGKADDLAVHIFAGTMLQSLVGLMVGSPFGISIANSPLGVALFTPVDAGIGRAAGAAQGLPESPDDSPPSLPTWGEAHNPPGDYPEPPQNGNAVG